MPLKYGVLGQETTGPGGFAMALRTIPVALTSPLYGIVLANAGIDRSNLTGGDDASMRRRPAHP